MGMNSEVALYIQPNTHGLRGHGFYRKPYLCLIIGAFTNVHLILGLFNVICICLFFMCMSLMLAYMYVHTYRLEPAEGR